MRDENLAQIFAPTRISEEEAKGFSNANPTVYIVDHIDGMLEEYFRIKNPTANVQEPDYYKKYKQFKDDYNLRHERTEWFYYPWKNSLVHVLNEKLHNEIRTNRNKNLISEEEQNLLESKTIGVAGLSVGSNVLMALCFLGPFKRIKIADFDELTLSNLNRIRAGLTDLGISKAVLAARGIYELNPYANVEVFDEGLNEENLNEFLSGLDIAIDEMDGLDMKIRLRLAAKEAKIPLVMVTDNGDNCLVDIERYDQGIDTIFHGNVSEHFIDKALKGDLEKREWLQIAIGIIGIQHVPHRLLKSLPEIGKSLVSQPQLGSSAMLSGSVAAYIVRMILLGKKIKSGKLNINIESELRADFEELDKRRLKLLESMR